jgi:hypothetical protein
MRPGRYGFMHRANAGPPVPLQDALSPSAVLVMAMVPPGQVAETSFSPGLQASSHELLAPQVSSRSACRFATPAGPVGPASPFAPAGPGGPAAPCGPAGPCGPSKHPASENAAAKAIIANVRRMKARFPGRKLAHTAKRRRRGGPVLTRNGTVVATRNSLSSIQCDCRKRGRRIQERFASCANPGRGTCEKTDPAGAVYKLQLLCNINELLHLSEHIAKGTIDFAYPLAV